MRVVLWRMGARLAKTFPVSPDLGLTYLYKSLDRVRHEVHYVDALLVPSSAAELVARYGRRGPWLLGTKLYTHQIGEWRRFIREVRSLDPSVRVVTGGPHPASVGTDIFRDVPETDYGYVGEGETSLPLLAELIENDRDGDELGEVAGLVYRRDGEVRANPSAVVQDVDDLDAPPWDKLPVRDYLRHRTPIRDAAMMPLTTTRGCPYHCSYCAGFRVSSRKMRYRNVELICDEIEHLHRTYGVESVSVQDENFSTRRQHVLDFAEALMRRDLSVRWDCLATGIRLDTLNVEDFELMERSGLHAISVAIESPDQDVLKDMIKGTYIDDQTRRIREIKRRTRIVVNGYFILGYPAQTAKSVRLTQAYSRRSELDYALFFLFTPLPGTEIAQRLEDQGRLSPDAWETFQYDVPSLPLSDLSLRALKWAQLWAYAGFYLRPRRIRSLARAILGPSQVLDMLRRIRAMVFWRRGIQGVAG